MEGAIFSEHRNSAYIFHLEVLVAEVLNTTPPRLWHWSIYLVQFRYEIIYIPGDQKCWGDLLSR